jgi:hypothetical protein
VGIPVPICWVFVGILRRFVSERRTGSGADPLASKFATAATAKTALDLSAKGVTAKAAQGITPEHGATDAKGAAAVRFALQKEDRCNGRAVTRLVLIAGHFCFDPPTDSVEQAPPFASGGSSPISNGNRSAPKKIPHVPSPPGINPFATRSRSSRTIEERENAPPAAEQNRLPVLRRNEARRSILASEKTEALFVAQWKYGHARHIARGAAILENLHEEVRDSHPGMLRTFTLAANALPTDHDPIAVHEDLRKVRLFVGHLSGVPILVMMAYLADLAAKQGSTEVHGVCDIAHTQGLFHSLAAQMALQSAGAHNRTCSKG